MNQYSDSIVLFEIVLKRDGINTKDYNQFNRPKSQAVEVNFNMKKEQLKSEDIKYRKSDDQTIQTNSMRGEIKEEESQMTVDPPTSEYRQNDILDKFVLERSIIYEEVEDQMSDTKPTNNDFSRNLGF